MTKKISLFSISFGFLMGIGSCQGLSTTNPDIDFKVLDIDTVNDEYIQIMLQSPDTNWDNMKAKANSLVESDSNIIAIGFSLGNNLGFNEKGGITNIEEMIAVYKIAEDGNGYIFTRAGKDW